MAVNIEALFQHLMEDPDIVPPEGESKKDIAIALATQRAKQASNNEKALNMAVQNRSVSKLLTFLKAAEDDDEEVDPAEFRQHLFHFDKFRGAIAAAEIKGGEYEWPKIKPGDIEGDERVGETTYKAKIERKQWDDAVEYLQTHAPKMVAKHEEAIALASAGGQEAEMSYEEAELAGEGEEEKVPEKGREAKTATGSIDAGSYEGVAYTSEEAERQVAREEREARKTMTATEREADWQRRLKEAEEGDTSAYDKKIADAIAGHVSTEVGDIEEKDAEEKRAAGHPYHPSKFGDSLKQKQGFSRVMDAAGNSMEFLEAAHDWNTRPAGDKGEEGGDGLPGNGRHPYSHHMGGAREGSIDPDNALAMIRQYKEALEDKARQAPDAEGTPMEPTAPVSEDASDVEKLGAWAGKPVEQSELSDYHDKMDNLLNKFKSGFAARTGAGSGRSIGVRRDRPEAAQAFDDMREAWDDAGWEAKRESGEIDDSQYYEAVDKFVRDNRDAFNEHYHEKNQIRENHIPDAPTDKPELPAKETQSDLMDFLETANPSGGEVAAKVEEASEKITRGKGTAKKKVTDVKALTDFAAEAVKETNKNKDKPIEHTPLSEDDIEDKVATDAVVAVREDEVPKESLDSAENLVGNDKLGEIAEAHGLPKSKTPMSANAKLHLRENGIDPEGEGLDHIKNIRDAKAHVAQHETDVEQSEASTPGLDAFSEAHMQRWLDRHVGEKDGDRGPERDRVEAGLRRQLEEEPGLLEGENDHFSSWPRIRQMAEANNFMPEIEDSADEPKSLQERIADATRQAGEEVERVKAELATATENKVAAEAAVKAAEKEPATKPKTAVEQLSERQQEAATTPDEETPDVFEEDVRGRDLGARDNFNGKDVTLEHQSVDEETGIRHELWTNDVGEGVVRQIDESGAIIESADGGLNAIHDRYNKNLEANELDPYTPTDTPELTEEAAEVADEPVKETPPKKEPRKRAPRAKKGTAVEELVDHVKEPKDEAASETAEEPVVETPPAPKKKRASRAKTGTPVEQLTDYVEEEEKVEEPPKTKEPRKRTPKKTEGEAAPKTSEPPAEQGKFDMPMGTPPPDDPPKTSEASADEKDLRVPLAPVQPVSARESEALAEYQTPTPKPKEAVPRVDQGEFDMPDAEDTPAEEPAAEKPLTAKQKSSIKTATTVRDKAQESLDEQQAIHDKHKEANEAAKTKYEELDESRNQPGVTEADNFRILDEMKDVGDAGLEAQKGQRDAQGHMNRHQGRIDNANAQIERAGGTPTEEVTPTEAPSEETPTEQPTTTPTEGAAEEDPTDEGTGEDVGEPVGDEAPTPRAQRRVTERQSKMRLRGRGGEAGQPQVVGGAPTLGEVDEAGEPVTEETVTATTGEGAGIDRLTREVTPVERERREAGRGPRTLREGRQPSFEDYEGSPQQAEAEERGARAGAARENVSMKRNELKTKFGMEERFVDGLTDEAVHQKHEEWESKNNSNKANEQMKRGFSKEDVFKAMAKADGREGDEDYLNTLRDRYQFDSPDDVKKEHMEQIKRRAESAHSMKQDAAIAEAMNMTELPDDVDSYHAENRLRDIVKKLDDHKQSHEKEGKPLLDLASVKNLKELTSDAVNKGDLSGEDMERIHAELADMGHKFWDDDHQSQLDGEHESARQTHEEHMGHVSGPGGHEARVEAFDHSKAHELHHYTQNEDGTRGERTGATYNRKDADGKRERVEGRYDRGSGDDAVEHLEDTKHPPKVPGLTPDEKGAQDDHFKLIKKGRLRSDDETATMKQLEQDNPFLQDPQYKAQVLGGNRHRMSGENGEEVMNDMNLSPDQQEEAQLAACQAPPGAMPPPSDDLKPKAWNPATHRWCDKEYLEGLQGGIGEGEGMLMPNGLHHGTENAHLDQDAAGNVQGAIVTKDGVFKHHPPAKLGQTPTGPMGASDLAGHALSEAAHAADITGHGDKISKDIMDSTGHGHSATHGTGSMANKPPPPGPTARRNRLNKKREQQANATTGIQRQMSRRGTEGSPLSRFLSGAFPEGIQSAALEVAGEAPGYLGGGQVRGTDAWQKHQIKQATKTVQTKERAATKFRRLMDEVQQESS